MEFSAETKEAYRKYKEKKRREEVLKSKSGDAEYYAALAYEYKAYKAKKAYEQGRLDKEMAPLLGRIDAYGKNHDTYLNEHYTRYGIDPNASEGAENTKNDEYLFRNDTQDYLDKVTGYKNDMAAEAAAIKRELEFYEPYLDKEYYNAVINDFDIYGKNFDSMINVATKDHDWWSKWESEDQYKNAWYNDKFNEKYAGIDTADKWQEAWDVIDSQYSQYGGKDGEMGPYYVPDDILREREYLSNFKGYKEYIDVKNYDADAAQTEIDALNFGEISNDYAKLMKLNLENNIDELENHLATIAKKYGFEEPTKAQSSIANDTGASNGLNDSLINGKGSSVTNAFENSGLKQRRGFHSDVEEKMRDLYYSTEEQYNALVSAHNKMLEAQKLLEYNELKLNPDFEEKSRYVSNYKEDDVTSVTGALGTTYIFSDNIDPFYEYINKNPEVVFAWNQNDSASYQTFAGIDDGFYQTMTDDEVRNYNYLYYLDKQDGGNRAGEYLEFISNIDTGLRARDRKKEEEYFSKLAKEDPIGSSVASVITSPLKGISYVGQIIDYAGDGEINKNAGYNKFVYNNQAIRNTVSQQIEQSGNWGEAGSFAYGVGMSMGDFLFTTAISGGNSWVASAIMGASAAADTTLSGLDQGLDSTRSIFLGTVAGLTEVITEKIGIDNLFNINLLKKNWVGYVIKNALSEGGEEVATDLVNWTVEAIYDVVASQDQSEWKRMIAAYMEQGYTESEATGMAIADRAKQLGLDFAGGAISGGIMGGGGVAINSIGNAINTSKVGKSFIKQNGQSGVSALTAQGLSLNQDTAAYKQAAKVQSKIDSGKNASRYSVGKLYTSMSESQTSTAVQTRLSAHIENKTEVRKLSNTITDILYGREVSNKAIKTLAANKYALSTLNDVLGSKLNKGATVSDIRAAVKSYQEAGKSKSGANAPTKAQQGSASKISGRGDVQFSAEKNANGGYDVIGTNGGDRAVFGSFKSQKQAQAAAYAMTLGMGAEGLHGLVTMSESIASGVDLGEAALAFNAFYNQGKSGKALFAAKNMELLSPEQRQYTYNLGIMDKALDGARAKSAAAEISKENDGKVLQKDGVGDTIKENEYAERSTKYGETLVEEKTGAETGQGVDNTTRGDRENETGDTQMRAAAGQRPSVSKRIRETTKGRQTLRRRLKRRLNTADKKYRALDCIIPKESSVAHHEQAVLDQYGVESYVIKNDAWKEPHIALTRNGIVYMREGIPESERGCVAEHEATHVMKQLRYQPYIDFLTRVGGMLDSSISDSDELTKRVADHANVDINTPQDLLTLYDELNAMLFGGRHNVSDSTRNAFYDYDAYIQELTEIHEQYKREVGERAERHDTIREFLKDTVAINSLVFGNKESPVSINAAQSNTIFGLDLELDTVPFYKGTVYSEIEVDSSEDLDDFAEMYADGHIASFDIFLDGKRHKPSQDTDSYRIELEISSNSGHDISLLEGFEDSDAVIFDRNSDFVVMEIQRTDKTLKIKLEDVSKGSWADNSNSQNNGNSDPDVQQAKSDQASSSEWSAERIKDGKAEKAKPISEIIEQIRHDFGINITKGHVRGKGVLGQYNKRDHGIRTKIANDLPTVSHELGHALDQRYGLTDKSKLTKEMKAELVNALGDLKGSYKQNLWVSEGLAEYIRRFLQNRDDAARAYPEFTKHFLNSLSKNDRILMDTFADEINAYYALDADTATSSIRLREEGVPDARTAFEKAKEMGDGVYQAWVDANHGIKLFDEATGADTYKLATNAAYSDAIAGQIITGDLTDANGQYVAPGLKSALEGVDIGNKQTYREFGEYLVLRHGPERLNEGMMIFADPRKNTAAFMAERQAKLEAAHPEFKEAADRLYEFQKQFLKTWAVDTGLIPSEIAEAWAKRWSFYVPLNRAVGKAGTIGAKRGYANQNSTVKKAMGSGLDIVHPVDNIINNIVKMVNAGVRNNVMLAITAQAEQVGADAAFLEKIPTPMKKKTTDMTGVKSKLQEAFKSAGIEELLAEVERDVSKRNEPESSDVEMAKAYGIEITSKQLEDNAREVVSMGKVSSLTGSEFEADGKTTLREKVVSFFNDLGNKVHTKEIGEVALTKTSFSDDKGHGLTRNKIVSFGAIPEVLQNGRVIDVYKPDGKPYVRITIAAPIEIAGEKYYMGVMVQKDNQSNRMYLHDVITEKATSSFSNGANHQNGEGIRDEGHLFITSILQKRLGVNYFSKKNIGNGGNRASDAWSQIDDIIESTIDDVLVQYGQGKAHGDVVTVLRNGKQEFWKINDALLLESLTNMSQKKMSGILEAYAVVSRFMTSNITGNNIVWSIFSNFPRDMMTFFTYSKQKNPLKAFPAMGEAYLNKVTDGKVDTAHLPYIKEYYALGGGQTSAYTADVDLAKRARKKIKHSTKLQSAAYYANPLNMLSFISETVESGPRIATYIMMREQGMSPQEAFYESQDITVNFKRGGRLSREFNKAVPFFNASVQGLDKFKRWITCADVPGAQRKKAIIIRTTTYVAVSAAIGALFYALNNWDDEDEENYRLLSNYTKNTYWNVPLGDGKYFAIPKPREIAVLSTFFETTCEYFGGNDYAYDGFGEYVADNFLPPFVSDFATGGFEGALGSLGIIGVVSDLRANKDFLGRPIESTSLQGYETQDRYTRRTSMIAYWLGQAAAEVGLDWSPVQIDYFFGQTLGGYWKVQKALFPVGSENVDWTLGVQNTYIKDNQYSNDIVNWLYDEADASSKAKKSNPDDMEIAIDAKMDSNLSTFYSRYYALTKGQKEDSASRHAKRVVLDMIIEYRKATDNGDRSAGEKAVYDIVAKSGDTSLLPAVMQSTIKDSNKNEIKLTDIQYVEYQTAYNALYWSFVEDNLGSAETDAEKIAILKQAQSIAKERATEIALKTAGGGSSGFFDKYSEIEDNDLVTFKTQIDLENDKDGSLNQEELIAIIQSMVDDGLSKEDAYTLFKSRYPNSDKNNPWRRYAP